MTIKEEFRKILQARARCKEQDIKAYIIAHGYDHGTIFKLLCRNYQETIEFLSNADEKEIATTVEVLDDLVRFFSKEQAKELIGVFKKKGIEFSNIQQYCDYDYIEQIEMAESYLEELE